MSDDDLIKNRLAEAEEEHSDLDAMISRVAEQGPFDQIQMQRMKKRKLQLKDEINYLRAKLIPDDIA